MVRINKYLADCGISSRRKSEEMILHGRVMVNNKTVTTLSYQIDEKSDTVLLDGERIKPAKRLYYMLNKPKGVITSTKDEQKRKTVLDLMKVKEKLFPVGRLDYNTTGILLLTNDGDFSQLLLHPKNKIIREYEVKLDRELKFEDEKRLLNGIQLDKRKSKFVEISTSNTKSQKNIIIKCEEGRNRFVKRMFAALGYSVKSLNRVSFAGLRADIPVGNYRKLSGNEVKEIINYYTN